MTLAIIFAIAAALFLGAWTVFHQKAASHINNLFGAIIISLTAVVLGTLILLPQLKSVTLYTNYKGIIFAVLAGVCALALDYFALKAYGSGLTISVAGPIIIAGSVAVAATIGFMLGESITWTKAAGLVLIIAGGAILAAQS